MALENPKSEKEWQSMNDARTLAEAHVILNDNKRLNAAKKMAEKMAKQQADELEGLLRVAGKLKEKVEGMKVIGKSN